jgi:hypothetical protein
MKARVTARVPLCRVFPTGWHVYTIKNGCAPCRSLARKFGRQPTGKTPEPEVNHGVENDAG